MTNESSSIMERLKQISPLLGLRVALLILFIGYYQATSDPDTGLMKFYLNTFPIVGRVLYALLPIGFLFSIGILMINRQEHPVATVLLASLPQFVYAIASAMWYVYAHPTLSPVALTTHIGISAFILLLAWSEVYYVTPD